MRCHEAEHLLSLNLDGRLSSGQRQLLLDHIAGCTACRSIDRELSAGRELALSLPAQVVSPAFREELWERIRAGEGTPEAVFREPVPLATKLRYLGIGAAAAGLLIAAGNYFIRASDEAPSAPQSVVREEGTRGLVPRSSATDELLPGVAPATPESVARLVADGFAAAARQLRARVEDLDGAPAQPQFITRIRDDADRARHFAGLLRWFMERDYLMLPPADAAEVATIELVGQQVRTIDDPDSLRRVLEPLRRVRVERTRSFFCSPCVEDEVAFFHELMTRMQRAPATGPVSFRIEVVEENAPAGRRQRFVVMMGR